MNAVGITQNAGGLTVGGASTINGGAGAVTLTTATNDFTGAVSLTGGATQITDANALTLGTLATGALTATSTGALNLGQGNVNGALVATSNNGAVTQTGPLVIAGSASIAAGAAPITLTSANDFQGAVNANNTGANAISLTDTDTNPAGPGTTGNNFPGKPLGINRKPAD